MEHYFALENPEPPREFQSVGGHQSARMETDVWLTPPQIITALGDFDLDPCSPLNRPWDTAKRHFTVYDNGLIQKWHGRVWLNPPYGAETSKWLGRLVEHRNGIALIFARTETDDWFRYIWSQAHSILFIKGRLHFHRPNGVRAAANSGGPSALISYNAANSIALSNSGIPGQIVSITAA